MLEECEVTKKKLLENLERVEGQTEQLLSMKGYLSEQGINHIARHLHILDL